MSEITLCYNCPKRRAGCHGDCEWFKAYNRAKEKERKHRYDEAIANDSTSSNWCYDKRGIR